LFANVSLIGLTTKLYEALASEKFEIVIVPTIEDVAAPVTNTFVSVFAVGDTCPRISYICAIMG
jgi:hypothetical protein